MYYVKKGKNEYFVGRGPKFKEGAFVGSLPYLGLLYYDYDDSDHWSDDYLLSEYRIVSDVTSDGYDPAAAVAARGEMNRRKGEMAPPWFDSIDDLIDDLNLAVRQEEDIPHGGNDADAEGDWYNENNWDNEDGLTPIVTAKDLKRRDKKLIRAIAEAGRTEKREADKYAESYALQILQSDFCETALGRQDAYIMRSYNEVDIVEDLKDLSARLMFIYGEKRGKKGAEDYFDAAMYLYRKAVKLQEEIENEDWGDETCDGDSTGEDPLEIMARLFTEHIKNADADDQFVAELGESTDVFLTEKGFDLSTLAGLKMAQVWLENAKAEEIFWSEGPIDNAIDKHIGEARIAAMLKIVKNRIDQRMKR